MEYQLTTGSSYISLDGVPFILDERAVPIKKVKSSLNISEINFEDILFTEYDDSIERNIIDKFGTNSISYLKTFYQMHAQLKDELINQINEINLSKASNNLDENNSIFNDYNRNKTTMTQTFYQPLANYNNAILYKTPDDKNNYLPEINAPNSTILFPTPITELNKSKDLNKFNKINKIDLRDFESEMDPFENISLKVINDIEELDKVFLPTKNVSTNNILKNQNSSSYFSNVQSTSNQINNLPINSLINSHDYYTHQMSSNIYTPKLPISYFSHSNFNNTVINSNQSNIPGYTIENNTGMYYTNYIQSQKLIDTKYTDLKSSSYSTSQPYGSYVTDNFKYAPYFTNNSSANVTAQSNNPLINGHHLAHNFYAQQAKSNFYNFNPHQALQNVENSQILNNQNAIITDNSSYKLIRTKSVPNFDAIDSTSCGKPTYLW